MADPLTAIEQGFAGLLGQASLEIAEPMFGKTADGWIAEGVMDPSEREPWMIGMLIQGKVAIRSFTKSIGQPRA